MATNKDQKQFSVSQDVKATPIKDIVPNHMIKVYPYEFINVNESRAFIEPQAISIAQISQMKLNKENNKLQIDDNGELYFEMLAGITSKGMLDLTSSTSVFGQTLKEEDSFIGLSNWYYQSELSKIQMGIGNFMPAMFVIGEPYDEDKYKKGEQAIFIPSSMVEAKEGEFSTIDDINPEGLYEFNLINIATIESQFPNCRIIPITRIIETENVINNKGESGISMEFEHHMLLQSVKAKGTLVEVDANGNEFGEREFGDIDFILDEKMAPFKMTPVSMANKATMYADWFDYDTVLPFVYVNKFKNGIKLNSHDLRLHEDDWKLISDMLLFSYLFSSEFQDVPILTKDADKGKIDPNFFIGYANIQVTKLVGKDPIKVIDGLFEKHIRVHPTFTDDVNRYQLVQAIINALSRYIDSTHAIGKGNNAFCQAYLPWYLEPHPTTGIHSIKTDDAFKPTSSGKHIILNPDIKFIPKTLYFHDKYSDDIPSKGKSSLILPPKVNISNVKLLQTDRKLTLPELPFQMGEITKLPLPGDIDTKSSRDLSYIYHLPIGSQKVFEDFMLSSLSTHTSSTQPTDVTIQIPPQKAGIIWNNYQARTYIMDKIGGNGTIKTMPIRSIGEKELPEMVARYEGFWTTFNPFSFSKTLGPITVIKNGKTIGSFPLVMSESIKTIEKDFKNVLEKWLEEHFHYGNVRVEFIDFPQDFKGSEFYNITFRTFVQHSEWTPAIVTVNPGAHIDTYSFQGRQVIFDKNEWEEFIRKFNIMPLGFNTFDLREKKGQKIKKLDEITIASMWGNSIKLHVGANPSDVLEIPLFNKDDETISIQRILFT